MAKYSVSILFADNSGFTKQVEANDPITVPILAVKGVNKHYMAASPIVEIVVKLMKE